MILVTGATGTVGSEVLRQLVQRDAAVRAMARNPERVTTPGVEVVAGDFGDPESLAKALTGIETVFLLTAPASPGAEHDLALLAAARAEGVRRIVRLSAIGTGETDSAGRTVGQWHEVADDAVRASGLGWTILRPSSFASNTLSWLGPINAGEPVPNLLGDARYGVIDPRDVAAVAVEALTSDQYDGKTHTLTGPELLSAQDQAAQLGEALGRKVHLIDVHPEVARDGMLAQGMDPGAVEAIVTGTLWAREGNNAILTDDVPNILGRPARTYATWARTSARA